MQGLHNSGNSIIVAGRLNMNKQEFLKQLFITKQLKTQDMEIRYDHNEIRLRDVDGNRHVLKIL